MLITLAEAKAQLNLEEDETDDDALIEGYIAGATAHFEQWGIVVDREERSWSFDRFGALMVIPATPVDPETVAVSYLDSLGVEQSLTEFRVVPIGKHHLQLLPAIGSDWPTAPAEDGVIMVTATAGFVAVPGEGDPPTSAGMPEDLKVAAKIFVAHRYKNREGGDAAGAIEELIDPYRLRRI